MPSRYFSSCFCFSKLNSVFQCYVFSSLSVAIVPKVSVAVVVIQVWVPVEWTEISMRVNLSVTSSHYICKYLEMSTCALALVFFVPGFFSSLCFFFFGNGLLFFQHEQRVILWRNACSSSGLQWTGILVA